MDIDLQSTQPYALANRQGDLAPTIGTYPRIMDTPHINVNTS